MIFNEIIELKFCGFDKNLYKNIGKREKLDVNIAKYIEEDEDSVNVDGYDFNFGEEKEMEEN